MYVVWVMRKIDRNLNASQKASATIYANFVAFQFILFAVLRALGV